MWRMTASLGSEIVMANLRDLGRPCGNRRLGHHGRPVGRASIHQSGRARLHCEQRRGDPRCAALCDGGRPAGRSAQRELRGLEAPRIQPEQILNIRRAYRLLYRSGLKLQRAVGELQKAVRDARRKLGPSSNSSNAVPAASSADDAGYRRCRCGWVWWRAKLPATPWARI